MATDLAGHSPAAPWIDTATRLREVRDAERRFLDLWHFERTAAATEPPLNFPQTSRWRIADEERSADC